jgi:hypothetical protein
MGLQDNGFPSAVRSGVILNASNIHKSWIGIDAGKLFAEATDVNRS